MPPMMAKRYFRMWQQNRLILGGFLFERFVLDAMINGEFNLRNAPRSLGGRFDGAASRLQEAIDEARLLRFGQPRWRESLESTNP